MVPEADGRNRSLLKAQSPNLNSEGILWKVSGGRVVLTAVVHPPQEAGCLWTPETGRIAAPQMWHSRNVVSSLLHLSRELNRVQTSSAYMQAEGTAKCKSHSKYLKHLLQGKYNQHPLKDLPSYLSPSVAPTSCLMQSLESHLMH